MIYCHFIPTREGRARGRVHSRGCHFISTREGRAMGGQPKGCHFKPTWGMQVGYPVGVTSYQLGTCWVGEPRGCHFIPTREGVQGGGNSPRGVTLYKPRACRRVTQWFQTIFPLEPPEIFFKFYLKKIIQIGGRQAVMIFGIFASPPPPDKNLCTCPRPTLQSRIYV